MTVEMLVGLQVVDEAGYREYRKGMTPILTAIGGGFGYDFKIAEVLKSATPAPINRLFTIHFPDDASREAFFADPEYLRVREEHFEPAVSHTTILSRYQRSP